MKYTNHIPLLWSVQYYYFFQKIGNNFCLCIILKIFFIKYLTHFIWITFLIRFHFSLPDWSLSSFFTSIPFLIGFLILWNIPIRAYFSAVFSRINFINVAHLQGHLLLGYWFAESDSYDINWTTPQCILTLRLIGMVMDVYDGFHYVRFLDCPIFYMGLMIESRKIDEK